MNGTTLNFHYDFLTSLVLNDPEFFTKKVPLMKGVGVRTVWLDNYIYGEWQNTPEEAARAKAMLEAEGFEVQAICVPLGHGGNALMGGDEDDPSLPPDFRNRIDANGNRMGTTTCVDEAVIENYRKALEIHKQLGFTQIYHDDDLACPLLFCYLRGRKTVYIEHYHHFTVCLCQKSNSAIYRG